MKNGFNVRNKMKVSVMAIIVALILAFGIFSYAQAKTYKSDVTAAYRRAYSELVDYVGNMDITLSKALVTSDYEELNTLAADLWRDADFAKSCLGQLPLSSTELDNTAVFLSQVGDYTYSLAKKTNEDKSLTDDEYAQLKNLSEYSSLLLSQLQEMEEGIMDGSVSLYKSEKLISRKTDYFGDYMSKIEEKFADYPSLVYDGPFSSHITDRKAQMTSNAVIIDENEAKKKAEKFLKNRKIKTITKSGETDGAIPSYDFTATTDVKNEEITVKITKNGGYPLMMLDSRAINNVKLKPKDVEKNATDFLENNSFKNMKQTGYIIESNCVLFAYAYVQNNITMYNDLIKIKISLDDGTVVGFESNGYLTNHTDTRNLPEYSYSLDELKKKLKPDFKVSAINTALIPLETGKDVYCYEVMGEVNDKTFLVYYNTETGEEEEILLYVKSEYGGLTV